MLISALLCGYVLLCSVVQVVIDIEIIVLIQITRFARSSGVDSGNHFCNVRFEVIDLLGVLVIISAMSGLK